MIATILFTTSHSERLGQQYRSQPNRDDTKRNRYNARPERGCQCKNKQGQAADRDQLALGWDQHTTFGNGSGDCTAETQRSGGRPSRVGARSL